MKSSLLLRCAQYPSLIDDLLESAHWPRADVATLKDLKFAAEVAGWAPGSDIGAHKKYGIYSPVWMENPHDMSETDVCLDSIKITLEQPYSCGKCEYYDAKTGQCLEHNTMVSACFNTCGQQR